MNCTIKRIWVFFIAFIIAIALCACANNMSGSQSGQNSASENTDILLEFKSFLDGEGFVGGVSQSKFIDEIVPQYTYEGKTIPEIIAGCNWDSENGGGWFAEDGRFGVSNFNESGVYMNRLYTTLPLHGLSLPFDIRFGDSVKKVINKMGVEFDPSDFTPDADSKTDITLISGNGMLVRYGDAGKNNRSRIAGIGSGDNRVFDNSIEIVELKPCVRNDCLIQLVYKLRAVDPPSVLCFKILNRRR